MVSLASGVLGDLKISVACPPRLDPHPMGGMGLTGGVEHAVETIIWNGTLSTDDPNDRFFCGKKRID